MKITGDYHDLYFKHVKSDVLLLADVLQSALTGNPGGDTTFP